MPALHYYMLGSDWIYPWMLLNLSFVIDFKDNPIFKIKHEKKEFLRIFAGWSIKAGIVQW